MAFEEGEGRGASSSRAIFWASVGASVLLLLPTYRLWFQTPLRLTAADYDVFLGLFARASRALFALTLYAGRALWLALFLLLGVLYLRWVRSADELTPRRLLRWAAVLAAVFVLALPCVSPDVFAYAAHGWLEAHDGLDPFTHTIAGTGRAELDEMFRNVDRGLVGWTSLYGPASQALWTAVATLSGGRILLALAIGKLFALALHAAAGLLVWRLAPAPTRAVATLAFVCSPLVLYNVLTAVHNDHLLVVFLLVALLLRRRAAWFACGAALALAFGVKYAPLLVLPLFLLDAAVAPGAAVTLRARALAVFRFVLGFASAGFALFLCHPSAVRSFVGVFRYGSGVDRNSVFCIAALADLFLVPGSFEPTRLALQALFAAGAVAAMAVFVRDRRAGGEAALERAMIAVFLLYFALASRANHEWYMTWLLGPAFVGAGAAAERLGMRLAAFTMPLQIFTDRGYPVVTMSAQILIYLTLVAFAIPYLRDYASRWRARRPGGAGGPEVPSPHGSTEAVRRTARKR